MKTTFSVLFLSAVVSLMAQGTCAAEQPEATPTQYLYIEQFSIPAGRTINAAIEEAKQWVKVMRASGDFKSVRLFFHHTGPEPAIYIFAEPKNWGSIESGLDAQIEAFDLMNKPFNWSGHSDNLLSEVRIE